MKKILFLLLTLLALPVYAFPHGGGASNVNTIGGLPIGYLGTTGIYSGMQMSTGDDFNGNLNIVDINNPNAPYFATHVYDSGARFSANLKGYDIDPSHTGSQDSNQGVAVGSANLSQASSLLTLQARAATAGELPYTAGKAVVDAMIHSGGYITVSAPAIIEFYVSYNAPNPQSDWHPTVWVMNANPLTEEVTGAPGSLEVDLEEGWPTGGFNFNTHGTTTGPASSSFGASSMADGLFHKVTVDLRATGIRVYKDDVQIGGTIAQDATNTSKPYYVLITNHLTNYTVGQWNSGQTATMVVDWYRIWVPNGQAAVLSPTGNLPTLKVDYNTSMTYTIPSATSLWGSAITDYCQGIKFEDFEPGSSTNGSGDYLQWPAGLSYNSGTRVLTGITTDKKPGRIHTSCVAYIAGGFPSIAARGYIDVGPNITTSSIAYSNATASFNVYSITDCGTLVNETGATPKKTVTVTGLPSGLTFNPSTFLITGTATTGAYTISISVTNTSGQTATNNSVTLTVGP